MGNDVTRRQFLEATLGAAGLAALGRSPTSFAAARQGDPVDDPFPFRFREVIGFHGDFGPGEVVNAKGVGYDYLLGQLIVSLSPFFQSSGLVQVLNAVDPVSRTRTRFAPGLRKMDRAIESKLVTVAPGSTPAAAGFVPGDVFVPITGGEIARVDGLGAVLADPWVSIADTAGFWGDLAFDEYGSFGGALLVLSLSGHVYSVSAHADVATVLDFGNITINGAPPPAGWGNHPEGITVAPAAFGPFAGQLIIGIEGANDNDPYKGTVYAVDAQGRATLVVKVSTSAEDVEVVPANGGTYYQCEIDFNRANDVNRLLAVTSSQFLARRGHLLVVNELAGQLSDVAWTGAGFSATVAGKVPGRWITTGFNNQNEELEAGCFAAVAPVVPPFSPFDPTPGPFTTRLPLTIVYRPGTHRLTLAATAAPEGREVTEGAIALISYDTIGRRWLAPEWTPVAGSPPTVQGPAAADFRGGLHLFAVRARDGAVVTSLPLQPSPVWTEVPGGMETSASLSTAVLRGTLTLCARSSADGQLCLNQLLPSGQWIGWSPVPGSKATVGGGQLQPFQDDLYVIARSTGHAVFTTAQLGPGSWTAWTTLPGVGLTGAQVAAAVGQDGQFHLFSQALADRHLHFTLASSTGTWRGGWVDLGAEVVAAPAATSGPRVYVGIVAAGGVPHLAHAQTG